MDSGVVRSPSKLYRTGRVNSEVPSVSFGPIGETLSKSIAFNKTADAVESNAQEDKLKYSLFYSEYFDNSTEHLSVVDMHILPSMMHYPESSLYSRSMHDENINMTAWNWDYMRVADMSMDEHPYVLRISSYLGN